MCMRKLRLSLSIFVLTLFVSMAALAQVDPPEDDDDVPVDGGVIVLVSLASLWGFKKIKGYKE